MMVWDIFNFLGVAFSTYGSVVTLLIAMNTKVRKPESESKESTRKSQGKKLTFGVLYDNQVDIEKQKGLAILGFTLITVGFTMQFIAFLHNIATST